MKRLVTLMLTGVIAMTNATAFAAEIPRETTPLNAEDAQVVVVENLIGDVLDQVAAGEIGYGIASSEADKRIRNAVFEDRTNGYGYGILSAITNNALRVTRDRVLRPELHAQYEEYLRALLSDLIADVANGRDMENAREAAYTRIYQVVNPAYTPREVGQDFCYMDTPAVDMAMFPIARKVLAEARN